MVRAKNSPAKTSTPSMAPVKCHMCDLALNRQGEKRPGILCKGCKKEHCNKCAELPVEYCEMVKKMDMEVWTCSACEAKNTDLKAVLESMKLIKSELSPIKEGQAEQQAERVEQQAERAQVLESLKAAKAVAKKLDKIEDVQGKHEQKLAQHDEAVKKNSRKCEQGEERITMLEEKLKKFDQNGFDLRRCNAVAKEVREIEKRERNVVIFNIPDSKEEVEEDREKADMREVESVFKELGLETIQPKNIDRIGKLGGRYPQQIRVVLRTVDDCETILKKCRDGTMLKNNVFITRDRTFNQRQEGQVVSIGRG